MRLLHPRRDPVFRCGQLEYREARLWEHVLQQQRLALCGLLAHLRLCNVIRVPVRLLQARRKRVPVRRKACARLVVRHNSIVRAARRRGVPVGRPVSVPADRLRGSHNVPAAVAGQVAATIKDQSERSVPEREFRRPNRASRSMRASPQHADGR